MKLFLIPACVLYILNATIDTTAVRDSQVKKIEIKANEIKAQPGKHSVDDVYGLLFKSIDLTKQSVAKSDSANRALTDIKAINKDLLTMVTQMQNTGQQDAEKMYLVNKYIESMPLAFAGIVLFAVIQILLHKKNHQIAL
jgi:hypothetical protein